MYQSRETVADLVVEAAVYLEDPLARISETQWQESAKIWRRVLAKREIDAVFASVSVRRALRLAVAEQGDHGFLDELHSEIGSRLGAANVAVSDDCLIGDVLSDLPFVRLIAGTGDSRGAVSDSHARPRPARNHARSLSVVVPYRDSGALRRRNLLQSLRFVRAAVSGIADVEIILVEQSVTSFLEADVLGLIDVHILARHDGDFNKSWALNVGARHSVGSALLLLDSDILIDRTTVEASLDLLSENTIVLPHKSIIWMDPVSSDRSCSVADESLSVATVDGSRARGYEMSGLLGTVVAVDREFYLASGGYNEVFEGWGDEDNEFLRRVADPRNVVRIDVVLPHLHHERPAAVRHEKARANLRTGAESRMPDSLPIGRLGKYNS